jgi:hypothetical protein
MNKVPYYSSNSTLDKFLQNKIKNTNYNMTDLSSNRSFLENNLYIDNIS